MLIIAGGERKIVTQQTSLSPKGVGIGISSLIDLAWNPWPQSIVFTAFLANPHCRAPMRNPRQLAITAAIPSRLWSRTNLCRIPNTNTNKEKELLWLLWLHFSPFLGSKNKNDMFCSTREPPSRSFWLWP